MSNGVRIVFIVVGIALAGAVSVMYAVRKEPWLSAEAAFQKGDDFAKKQHYGRAFHYLKMAADKDPGNVGFAWTATQMAVAAGNANAAYFYAQKAWKNGRKERDVLQTLVQGSFFSDKKRKLEYALSLVNQMDDSTDKDDLRAELYVGFGEIEQGRSLWLQQFQRTPMPAIAVKAAKTYLLEGRDSAALSFLQSCRVQHLLDNEGYGLLARLYAKKGNLKEAEACYREGDQFDKSPSGNLSADHAVFLMNTKNYDKAADMLDSLITKYPENKNFETLRITAFLAKGDALGALHECDKATASIGAVAPLRARALIRLHRLAEAETAYDSAVAHTKDVRVNLEFGNFLLYAVHNYKKAQTIFQTVHSAQPTEPVANIGLATLALEAKDLTGAKKHIAALLSEKKPAPYAYMLLAQVRLMEGNPKAALENCEKTLALIPDFDKALFAQAQAYSMLGRVDKADEILTALLRKAGGDTEKSALIKRRMVPVKVREKKYGDALAIVNELERAGASTELRRMRLEIYAFSGNIAKADETLTLLKPAMNNGDFVYYQSWLAELSGDTAKAASLLEPNLSTKRALLRWAGLRFKMGKTGDVMEKMIEDSMTVADWSRLAAIAEMRKDYTLCAQCYKHALLHEDGNATLLNNYAWASMQTPAFNHDEILRIVKKAYYSLSDRPEVLQTYAEALNKCDKAGECIKLLQDKPMQTKQSISLLYQLGTAYEKTGDLRGAVSSYRMVLQFPDSTPQWPPGVSRNDLQARVEQLKEKLTQN